MGDERLRLLLREIFTAAGGTHDDWAVYDQTMRDERRKAVLVAPTRGYSRPDVSVDTSECPRSRR